LHSSLSHLHRSPDCCPSYLQLQGINAMMTGCAGLRAEASRASDRRRPDAQRHRVLFLRIQRISVNQGQMMLQNLTSVCTVCKPIAKSTCRVQYKGSQLGASHAATAQSVPLTEVACAISLHTQTYTSGCCVQMCCLLHCSNHSSLRQRWQRCYKQLPYTVIHLPGT
jgi:hypothetical protein